MLNFWKEVSSSLYTNARVPCEFPATERDRDAFEALRYGNSAAESHGFYQPKSPTLIIGIHIRHITGIRQQRGLEALKWLGAARSGWIAV